MPYRLPYHGSVDSGGKQSVANSDDAGESHPVLHHFPIPAVAQNTDAYLAADVNKTSREKQPKKRFLRSPVRKIEHTDANPHEQALEELLRTALRNDDLSALGSHQSGAPEGIVANTRRPRIIDILTPFAPKRAGIRPPNAMRKTHGAGRMRLSFCSQSTRVANKTRAIQLPKNTDDSGTDDGAARELCVSSGESAKIPTANEKRPHGTTRREDKDEGSNAYPKATKA